MTQTITIDPVTRLEGHGKITIQLDSQGQVEDAHFHVTQVRGFERFSQGRPYYEMPSLMARICGICPVSHLIASAKACEAIMSVRIPHTAAQLRRMLNLAQMVQSHALSFFYLASPDLLLGMESDPVARNIFGVVAAKPQLGSGMRNADRHDGLTGLGGGDEVRDGADAADAGHERGHLVERAALGEALEAAHLGDVEVRIFDFALAVELDGDLAVAFEAGDGIDGDGLCHW